MIIFKQLRFQNFLSTGNIFTVIDLNTHQSTLIVGKNGHGKSTIIDALTFVLYGHAYRDINKPLLVNSITGKNCLVEVDFTIGSHDYMIRRGIKPNIFEIYKDGVLYNQNADAKVYQDILESDILNLNYKTYVQVVVLGVANYIPFMKLKAADRRSVVENFLDSQVFTVMNSLLKNKIQLNKEEISEVEKNIMIKTQAVDFTKKHIEKMNSYNDDLILLNMKKIESYRDKNKDLELLYNDVEKDLEILKQSEHDSKPYTDKYMKYVELHGKMSTKISALDSEIKFLHDNENCPVCKQGIDHNFRESTSSEKQIKLDELKEAVAKLIQEKDTLNEKIKACDQVKRKINDLTSELNKYKTDIAYNDRYIASLETEITKLKEVKQDDADTIDIALYEAEIKELEAKREELYRVKSIHEVSGVMLKDTGVKAKVVKQYIPIINGLIEKYLAKLDSYIGFVLDENFNETIRSQYRDEFSYSSFSEGEKLRIDIALTMTWRDIAKSRNTAATNLLILDEIFDGSADTDMQNMLYNVLADPSLNLFRISHLQNISDSYERVLEFEKIKNFSKVKEVKDPVN